MSLRKKIFFWLFFIIAGLFGTAVYYLVDEVPFYQSHQDQSNYSIDSTENFKAAGIKNIKINTICENIYIIPTDSHDIKVHFHGNAYTSNISSLPQLIAEQKGEDLQIKIKYKFEIINSYIGNMNTRLDVNIPKSFVDSIEAETVSGSLEIKDLNLDSLKFNSTSGNLEAADLRTTDVRIETVSGQINARSFTGNLDSETVSGDIDVEYADFNNTIFLNTTSGKIHLRLPKESQFSLNFTSVSGHFSSSIPLTTSGLQDGNNFEGSTTGTSSNKIEVNSVSGDLEIIN